MAIKVTSDGGVDKLQADLNIDALSVQYASLFVIAVTTIQAGAVAAFLAVVGAHSVIEKAVAVFFHSGFLRSTLASMALHTIRPSVF